MSTCRIVRGAVLLLAPVVASLLGLRTGGSGAVPLALATIVLSFAAEPMGALGRRYLLVTTVAPGSVPSMWKPNGRGTAWSQRSFSHSTRGSRTQGWPASR